MKRIYISLSITGREREAREHADLMKASLSRAGHRPVSPFDIYAGQDAEYEDRLCSGLRTLTGCDGIMLCRGWQFSRRCRIEASVAKEFEIQIFYEEHHDSGNAGREH